MSGQSETLVRCPNCQQFIKQNQKGAHEGSCFCGGDHAPCVCPSIRRKRATTSTCPHKPQHPTCWCGRHPTCETHQASV